jgi:hypothetical protein
VELTEKLGIDSADNFRRRWFNWRAAPILLGAFLLMIATVLFTRRRLWQGLLWIYSRPTAFAAWFHRARFQHRGPYRRLERLLQRYGMRRRSTQTPLEFCRMAAAELRSRHQRDDVVQIPESIARAFYRERFGQQPLDATETQSVEHNLFVLELALADQRNGSRKNGTP